MVALKTKYTWNINLKSSAQLTGVVEDPPNQCPGYNIKPSDGEALVLELWRI